MKRLVLLGGGHAHVHVLQALAREPLAGTEVLLVTPFERQMYSGMVPGLVAGHYRADECAIALPPLAQAARVTLLQSSATGLDAAARRVGLSDGSELRYDLLSLDTGAVMDRSRLPGAREHALFVRPIEHFVHLLDKLLALAAQRVLDIVLIGAGAAGVELAMALQHRLGGPGGADAGALGGGDTGAQSQAGARPTAEAGISARVAPGGPLGASMASKPAIGVRVTLVTGGPPPLAGYPAAVMARVQRALAARRIAVVRQACTAIEAGALVLADGTRLPCDAPLIATGVEAPAWLATSGLRLDAQGFVATGATLQSLSHAEVFAVGDVATRSDAPHPKSGVHAVRAGPPLALNLRRLVGGGPLQPHRPQARTLNLVSCGDRSAIAAWGAWSAEGRWVWWWKDRIDRAFVARYTLPGGLRG